MPETRYPITRKDPGRLRNRISFLLFTLAACFATNATADDYSVVPERFIYCTTCHGVELQGNRSVDAPRLNGMADWYVRNQLLAFKAGWRGTHEADLTGMEMLPQATVLDDAGIEEAVAFVASVPIRQDSNPVTVSGNATRGQALYATCAACHGEHAEGNRQLNAPGLVRQSDWYLVEQLEKFRTGVRGVSAGDIYGSQMHASAMTLPDSAASTDIVAFINSLR